MIQSVFNVLVMMGKLNKSVDNITEQKGPKKSESEPTENTAMKTVERLIEEEENKANFEDSIAKILRKVSEGGATLQSGIKSLLPVYFLDCIFIGTYFIFFLTIVILKNSLQFTTTNHPVITLFFIFSDYMMIIMLGVLVAFVALGIYTYRSVFLWLFLPLYRQLVNLILKEDVPKNNKVEAMLTGILEKAMAKCDAQLQEKVDKCNAQLQEQMDKCNAQLQEQMDKFNAQLQEKIDKLANISEKSLHREGFDKMKDALTTSVLQMSADIRQSFPSSSFQETYTGSDFVETKSIVKNYPCALM